MGVPLEDSAQFHQWAEQINTGPLDPPVGMAASKAMRDYLAPIVEDRRTNPRGDLISDLVHAEIGDVVRAHARTVPRIRRSGRRALPY